MVEKYLMDTNVVIDFLNGKLPVVGKNFIASVEPAISVISQIELLSNKNIPQQEWQHIQAFIQIAFIYALENPIVAQTITLRQNNKIKTPDAIIAATTLTHNLSLVTRNIADFKNIHGITLVDPHAL